MSTLSRNSPRKLTGYRLVSWLLVASFLVAGWSAVAPAGQYALAAAPPPMLYGSAPDAPDLQLQSIIEDVVDDLPGTWGVAVKKLDTGQYAAYNGDKVQVSASLYKLWVLAELYRQVSAGILDLDGYTTVSGEDAYYDASLGELRIGAGNAITLRQAAELMITLSDNTAAHLLVRTLGPDNINRFMQKNELSHSVLDWSGGGDNLTTPLDVLRELQMMATSQMVDAGSSAEMIGVMLRQQINNLLPPGLPDGTPFAHKTGALGDLLHDAGIVYSPAGAYVIVVMASELDDYGTAWTNMPELSRRVYEYFNSRPSSPVLYFPQTRQVVGHDFLKFWHTHGGVSIFGYPISAETLQDGLVAQQFERARFEWHPGASGAGGAQGQLVLGLLGQERASQLGLTWPRSADPGAGKYFDQTGQSVSGEFLNFWESYGGEAVFGYPISPAAETTSSADGKVYLTQWFQRARMEIHPDLPPGNRVVLGALGTELAAAPR